MKQLSILKNTLFCILALSIAPAALAVSDEEFNALRNQFDQLVDQLEENNAVASDIQTTVGGYGELHYNNVRDSNGDRKIDFHRFVLFFNHEFNDRIRFFSELEIEHALAGDGKPGEVEVEQAFIQFDINQNTQANAGLFLIPVGIINETHEPPTFYGVERNPVEKNIIPATWWEAGAMLSGNTNSGFSYDAALTSGLDGGTNIRGGHQKVAKATANNLAATLRGKYTGIPGLKLSATLQYQDDVTQDTGDSINGATLIETHARWSIAKVTLTGLYARWNFDLDSTASQTDKDKKIQGGGYLEVSYKVSPAFGVFVRQNEWDNGGSGDTEKSQTDIGFNYWPHENVVIKADYQAQNNNAGNFDGINLGLGYQF